MLEKITCPECQKVLRPAKPIPPGKKVKCPQCGEVFTAEADADAGIQEPRGKAPPGSGLKKPTDQLRKKSPPEKPAPPARETIPLAPADDDDDDGGTYGVREEPQAELDKPKPKIEYAPDMSIKDLRGPAQALVIPPTNYMLRNGVLGFLGWIALLVIVLVPAVFPLTSDEGTKEEPLPILELGPALGAASDPDFVGFDDQAAAKKTESPDRPFLTVFGMDMAAASLFGFGMFLVVLSPIFLGMIWSGLVCVGAVQAQNLESRIWGIVASIMCMIPYTVVGLVIVKLAFLELILGMVLGPDDTIYYAEIGIIVTAIIVEIAIGAWTLIILLRPEVVAGFEFVPESEGGTARPKEEDEDEEEDEEEDEDDEDDEDDYDDRRSRGRAARRKKR